MNLRLALVLGSVIPRTAYSLYLTAVLDRTEQRFEQRQSVFETNIREGEEERIRTDTGRGSTNKDKKRTEQRY